MRTSDRDTIAAIATGPGEGAIGIVRLSGDRAIAVADACFRGALPLRSVVERTLTYGTLVHKNQVLDEVLVSVMKGPATYTGEDSVEINCHGGSYVLQRAMVALLEAGARSAERGEFTRRAFLNGRMDLTQAQAVGDLIGSRADLSLQSAYFQLRGGLRERFGSLAEKLRHALMLLEAGLDFADDAEVDAVAVSAALAESSAIVIGMVNSYQSGRMLRDGARVALVGRPNVGKSSLMNRLLEEDRSIVTEIPGTTRDTIEETVDLDGVAATLVDTAGLRETGDPVEREGTRRSQLSMASADLVIVVVEGHQEPMEDEIELLADLEGCLVVLNKADLGRHTRWEDDRREPKVWISAKTGEGVELLRRRMRESILGVGEPNPEAITHQRHADLLARAADALAEAEAAVGAGLPAEIAAMEVRGALDSLADIIGETTPDDILDQIFLSFCIGK